MRGPFISPACLHRSSRIPLDATWFMPNSARNALSEFNRKRIPNARFFDIDAVSNRDSPFPHMFPSASTFAAAMALLRVEATDDVCLYDTHGLFSAARAYMTFRMHRHAGSVTLLEGGLPAWEQAQLPLETGPPSVPTGRHATTPDVVVDQEQEQDGDTVVEFDEICKIVRGEDGYGAVQVVDARPSGRFHGTAREPRAGLSAGHMPRSLSLPYTAVLDDRGRCVLEQEPLKRVLRDAGIHETDPIVVTCGTGVTACVVAVALETLGVRARIYDESWTGYADPSRAGAIPGMIIKLTLA